MSIMTETIPIAARMKVVKRPMKPVSPKSCVGTPSAFAAFTPSWTFKAMAFPAARVRTAAIPVVA